jgi:hypothetical protein
MLSRRNFLKSASLTGAAGLVLPHLSAQVAAATATLKVGPEMLAAMPADFTGLSYEIVELYDPKFFSATSTELVKAFRELAPHGVLRLGGNLSDVARWKSDAGDFDTPKQAAAVEKGKLYWEWKLTDTTARANRGGAITPEAIKNLRTFLAAANWRLLYGLNFGSGSPERAADEAACVSSEIGDRLVAFQIGNESDFFGGNRLFRERPYGFEQYYAGYQEFTEAIRKRVPTARFAGPDVANNMAWVEQFAVAQASEPAEKMAVFLSGHYYAMGPASNPAMNAERLLAPNPKLEEQIAKVNHAKASSGGLPYRMTEGNSCFGGGKPGVSDSFCSALWGADYMLHLASAGYSGVNLHGGGDGYYTPIEALDTSTVTLRPLYAGMQFAQLFAGMQFVSCDLQTDANVTVYVARDGHVIQQAVINKSKAAVAVTATGLPGGRPQKVWSLSAPDLSTLTGVSLRSVSPGRSKHLVVPAYSAVIRRWS